MSFEMKLLDWLRVRVEEDRPVCPKVDFTSTAESGDRFISFGCLRKAEGEMRDSYSSVKEACEVFLTAFREYAVGKDGWVLYWRQYPHLVYDDGDRSHDPRICSDSARSKPPNEPPSWFVYARLVLSELKEPSHD